MQPVPGRIAAVVAALALLAAAEAGAAPRGPTIVWGGDLTLGSSYGRPPDRGWPQLAGVAGVLRHADVAAVNLEGTFGTGGASKCGGAPRPNCFAFQAPPANASTLARAGVDIVNQANNHAYDFGPQGWSATRAALRSADVARTGAPGELTFLRRRGVRFAFAGFSTYRWAAPMNDYARVRDLIGRAARRADIVVAFFHGGAEGNGALHVPAGHERAFGEDRGDSRRFARTAIDAGADLVLGSGPHVLRGMQVYRGRLVAYSLGNLTGWRNFNTSGNASRSALLKVSLDRDGHIRRAGITSLRLDRIGVPHRDPTGAAAGMMRWLSNTDFGESSAWRVRFGRVL
jgi:Bacterial capsule synthesis protein PGA_cap